MFFSTILASTSQHKSRRLDAQQAAGIAQQHAPAQRLGNGGEGEAPAVFRLGGPVTAAARFPSAAPGFKFLQVVIAVRRLVEVIEVEVAAGDDQSADMEGTGQDGQIFPLVDGCVPALAEGVFGDEEFAGDGVAELFLPAGGGGVQVG
jgi:hypothetical protein